MCVAYKYKLRSLLRRVHLSHVTCSQGSKLGLGLIVPRSGLDSQIAMYSDSRTHVLGPPSTVKLQRVNTGGWGAIGKASDEAGKRLALAGRECQSSAIN